MENFRFHDVGLEKEKAKAALRFSRLHRIGLMFRALEFFIFLFVVSRFSSEFSFSFKMSGDWFRGVSVAIVSPRFVFVVVNAIIVALVLGSGKLSSEKKGEKLTDYYDEYVQKCQITRRRQKKSPEKLVSSDSYSEFGASQSEKTIIAESPPTATLEQPVSPTIPGGVDSANNSPVPQSGGVSNGPVEEMPVTPTENLQQSVKISGKGVNFGKKSPARQRSGATAAEEMTGEELRQKAEAFIERQRRFLMGENNSS